MIEPATPSTTTTAYNAPPIGPAGDNFVWNFVKMVCRIVGTLCFDQKVYGRHHVPQHGGVLIVANHQSFLDPIATSTVLRRPMSYFAKSELFETKYLGWLLTELHGFPVKQGEGDIGAVRQAIHRLKEGYALMIFPEGSRTEDGEIAPIEPGVGLIARKAGVPVVPCVIDGAFNALPRGAKMIKCVPIRVQYGPPMYFDGMKASQITAQLDQTLRTMFDELRSRPRPSWL